MYLTQAQVLTAMAAYTPPGSLAEAREALEDAQDSLIAAMARIESYRQTVAALRHEIGQLRAQNVAGGAAITPGGGAANPGSDEPAQAAAPRPAYICELGEEVPLLLLAGGEGKVRGATGAPGAAQTRRPGTRAHRPSLHAPRPRSPLPR